MLVRYLELLPLSSRVALHEPVIYTTTFVALIHHSALEEERQGRDPRLDRHRQDCLLQGAQPPEP